MPTLNFIREELKEIRYYMSRKSVFDKVVHCVGKNAIERRLEIYNEYICEAPPRLYDLYVSLYLENNTQESLSEKLGYSMEHFADSIRSLSNSFSRRWQPMSEVAHNGSTEYNGQTRM